MVALTLATITGILLVNGDQRDSPAKLNPVRKTGLVLLHAWLIFSPDYGLGYLLPPTIHFIFKGPALMFLATALVSLEPKYRLRGFASVLLCQLLFIRPESGLLAILGLGGMVSFVYFLIKSRGADSRMTGLNAAEPQSH